jgi:hypothetical protein
MVLVCGCAVLNYASVLANSDLLSKKFSKCQIISWLILDCSPGFQRIPLLKACSSTSHINGTFQGLSVLQLTWYIQSEMVRMIMSSDSPGSSSRRFRLSYLYIHGCSHSALEQVAYMQESGMELKVM